MLYSTSTLNLDSYQKAIIDAYRVDESEMVELLLKELNIDAVANAKIEQIATQLVQEVRKQRVGKSGLDSFLFQYNLSSEEGIALMCLAEALLRVPDKETIDKLISDKISSADWSAHLGKSESIFVNAATWGLMLTGKIYETAGTHIAGLSKAFKGLVRRGGEPFIRKAVHQAMKILGKQFVMGRSMKEALKRARELEKKGYLYSYDMLGEAACTAEDAEEYFSAYQSAIKAMASAAKHDSANLNPGISVKLSALHPRYEYAQKEKALPKIIAKVQTLAKLAKDANLALTIDAEESYRLDLSLEVIEAIFTDKQFDDWHGFGLALQSYQKRAWYIIDWLVALAQKHQKRWRVRLIKGAYWDSEIKLAQELGLEGYPVFTRKMNTDVSFLSCAQKILKYQKEIYPLFATHNAHSVATILALADEKAQYEFQCLHGMGQALYDQVVGKDKFDKPCRIYAPVGSHEDLLPYLVRRLLENGANTSFVNRIIDEKQPVQEIVANPMLAVEQMKHKPHPSIPLPQNLYQERLNSHGIDLTNPEVLAELKTSMDAYLSKQWQALPTVLLDDSKQKNYQNDTVINPRDHQLSVGTMIEADVELIKETLARANAVAFEWEQTNVSIRADLLDAIAGLFETQKNELMSLAVLEAGKTIPDALAEVREAIDFCRYYACQARKLLGQATTLPGPTGELNQLTLRGRGPMVCISPWNFPLAIFTGQVVAALVAGNPVIAKPANQTPLIAAKAIELMHEAGVPKDVVQLLPARGSAIGKHLIANPSLKGVVFTGSTETAQTIQTTLVNRGGEIIPLVAETGGQNAMIVDSSALPEQVVHDVIASAFNSAGQRCSALRVLFLQEDIADRLLKMLKGAMAELVVGDPALLATDVGPVIDTASKETLEKHIDFLRENGRLIYQVKLPPECQRGSYVAPTAYEIDSIQQLSGEVFGPIFHVVRYKSQDLAKVVESINQTHYGLTLGIHSRVAETIDFIQRRACVGNCYVNRNMVGAVVGVQPFGGEGLSGTGPKAGGPHYLLRLSTERTLSVNTAAAGGNASLMCLQDDQDSC